MEEITFGETDGDAEAMVLRGCVGYTVKVARVFHDAADFSIAGVDGGGLTLAELDDDGNATDATVYASWADIESVHIY